MKRFYLIPICLALTLICAFGVWYAVVRVRYPYHFRMAEQLSMNFFELRKWCGKYCQENETAFGLELESSDGNWTKVAEMAGDGGNSILLSYYANLAAAMQGHLPDSLMYRYQPFDLGLFLPVDEESSKLWVIASGEVWYRLGEMTMAEHSTILGLAFSPRQRGPLFFRRMAQISMINGEYRLAEKYLNLLGEPLDEDWREIVPLKPEKDFVHSPGEIRPVLKNLLESCPDNRAAYDYLLCYDLLVREIGWFEEDFMVGRKSCRLFQEAALIYMAASGDMDEANFTRFGIEEDVWNDFNTYSEIYERTGGDLSALSERFRYTYWFFYHFAKRNENGQRI